jgi:hypothetical protein
MRSTGSTVSGRAEEKAAETFRTLVVINSVTVRQLLGVSVFGAS